MGKQATKGLLTHRLHSLTSVSIATSSFVAAKSTGDRPGRSPDELFSERCDMCAIGRAEELEEASKMKFHSAFEQCRAPV